MDTMVNVNVNVKEQELALLNASLKVTPTVTVFEHVVKMPTIPRTAFPTQAEAITFVESYFGSHYTVTVYGVRTVEV